MSDESFDVFVWHLKCISIDLADYRIAPGSYIYSFQCMLPPELPTSVEANIGHIRYLARVVVDIPMAFDKEFEVPFTVIKAVNLNAIPALRVITLTFALSFE